MLKMKEIPKVVQKLLCEQKFAAAQAAAQAAAASEPWQKHKVTPGILGWLNYSQDSENIVMDFFPQLKSYNYNTHDKY